MIIRVFSHLSWDDFITSDEVNLRLLTSISQPIRSRIRAAEDERKKSRVSGVHRCSVSGAIKLWLYANAGQRSTAVCTITFRSETLVMIHPEIQGLSSPEVCDQYRVGF